MLDLGSCELHSLFGHLGWRELVVQPTRPYIRGGFFSSIICKWRANKGGNEHGSVFEKTME